MNEAFGAVGSQEKETQHSAAVYATYVGRTTASTFQLNTRGGGALAM